MIGNKQPEL